MITKFTVVAAALAATAMTAPLALAAPPHWTIQATTNPAGSGATNVLQAVSCPSATACLAVGFTRSGPANTAMAESWNGTSWTTTPPVVVPGASRSVLEGISCTSASACVSVGFYRDAGGTQHVLAARWNGTSWTDTNAPDPAGSQSPALYGVSCVSAADCEAVGSYYSTQEKNFGDLAEVWNGQTWTIQPAHVAFPKMGFLLDSVACTSASSCLAVGQFVSTFGATPVRATWAERWNGTTWSGLFPDVEGTASGLDGVSCPTATRCTTVGWYRGSGGTLFPLAEGWNGSAWSLQFPASSALATAMILTGVSCPTTTFCEASGLADVPASGPGARVTVAQSWNGSFWTLDNTPDPLGSIQSTLNGVSCPAATVCTAVGFSQASTPSGSLLPPATLAERLS